MKRERSGSLSSRGSGKPAIRSFVAGFCVPLLLLGALPRNGSAETARSYILGGSMLHNIRRGHFDFGDLSQDTTQTPLRLWGFLFGKQYPLAPWLLLQVAGMVDFGGVDLDTIDGMELSDGSVHQIALTHDFLHLSCVPELQYLFPEQNNFSPFLRMGLGVNYVRIREEGRINDEGSLVRQSVDMQNGMEADKWSVALQGGVGLKFPFGQGWSVALAYAYRYWHPVRYGYMRDLPLRSIRYWESFRSHLVEIVFGFRA